MADLPRIAPTGKLTIIRLEDTFTDCLGWKDVAVVDEKNNFFTGWVEPGKTIEDVQKWTPTFPMRR